MVEVVLVVEVWLLRGWCGGGGGGAVVVVEVVVVEV